MVSAPPARVAGISGLVFTALFVVALVLLHRAPHLADPDATYATFYARDGQMLFVAIGLYLVPLAGIAFLWHMTAIRAVLDTLTPAPSAMAHGLNLLAGAVFVTMLFAGSAAVGAVALSDYLGGPPITDPSVARALTAVGYGLVFVFAVRGGGMFRPHDHHPAPRRRRSVDGVVGRRLPARRVPAARGDQQPRGAAGLPRLGGPGRGRPARARPPCRGPDGPRRGPARARPRDHPRRSPRRAPAMTASDTTAPPAAARTVDDVRHPKGVPLLGNVREVHAATLIQDLMGLAREYGPIYAVSSPSGTRYVVSGLEMVDDLCDDARFDKLVGLSQREFRKTHESAGLFTADTDDPLWQSAHDILLPSFSTWAIGNPDNKLKWDRSNPTGHGIVFLSRAGYVFCYVQPGGV